MRTNINNSEKRHHIITTHDKEDNENGFIEFIEDTRSFLCNDQQVR